MPFYFPVCKSDLELDFDYVIGSVVCTDQTSDLNYFACSVKNQVESPIVPSLR